MSEQLTFEHPLNERMRTFLRLEHLFRQMAYFLAQNDALGTRAGVGALLDIVSITARADIKTELLKELDRNVNTLRRIGRQPGVDPDALGQVLDDLQDTSAAIQRLNGQLGQSARDDEFLKAIAQRSTIPGGTCSFDQPHFHYWLTQPAEVRAERLALWTTGLDPVRSAISLLLHLTRTSARARNEVAEAGFFQEALDPSSPAQLVRIGVHKELNLFPEISGHKNRFAVRFMAANIGLKPAQCSKAVAFKLTCCVI